MSSRPTDRRSIIESGRHHEVQDQEGLAEARLEDAKTNLNRVNDISKKSRGR